MERTGYEQWKPREVARLLALVEAERRYYQEMVAALPVALVVLSANRTIVSANRAFRQIVDLRYEDLRNRNIEQILPSDELIERIRSAHVHGDTLPFFLTIGDRRLRVAVAPIRSWEDEMEAETLIMLDDLRGTEPPASIARQPDLSAMPAVFWQADASTLTFTYVGGAAKQLFGFPPDHWLASPQFFSERIHPDDRAEVLALFQSVIAAGGEATAEFRCVSASGAVVWCRETIRVPAPARYQDGDQEAGTRVAAGVLTAVGQRRQLEAQAQTAARIEALRNLSGRLAHDLNNSLMIVTGYGEEILNALPAADALRNDVAEMMTATGRVTELAAQLLAFTRTQAKAPARISLRALAPRVELDLGTPDLYAYADLEQLEEALLTLAGTRPRIVCDTEYVAEQFPNATLKPGAYVRLAIQTKTAPAPDLIESFLPGKDPRHASGPAAARAYLNVRQWGGDIRASSEGFTIYLPLAESESAAAQPAPAPEPVPVLAPPTILIVEDEPGIRALVRKILRRENYEVLEAGSGEEALKLAAAHPGQIDLLLTDVMLPEMNGRELAAALLEIRPAIKVIYVSGYTGDESLEFPPGAHFLAKPFTLGALTGKVREAL